MARMHAFRGARAIFQGTIPIREIHVHRAHVDAVLLRVAHDLRRRVEAHRLAVEQRGREHLRVVAFDPGRDIDQDRKARGVAFRKAVFAEALDLLEAARGEFALVAAIAHAIDEFLLEPLDGADALERRHRAPQPVGFLRLELRRDDGEPHRLLLEQRNTQGLLEHALQLVLVAMLGRWRGIVRLDALIAQRFASAQIGMHHLSLDRSRPHDRDLDHEIVEFLRAQPRQHRHLRPAFDLEHADGVGARDHPVDRFFRLLEIRKVVGFPIFRAQEIECAPQARQHAEAEHIDLEDAESH